MSNQFYDYLSKKLLNFFEENKIKEGNRYFIKFDEDDQALSFYKSLKRIAISRSSYSDFSYIHEKGTKEYKTFAIELNGIKLVVCENVNIIQHDSFLNNLRNRLSDQEGIWEDTSLLIICTEVIDSIYRGAKDLREEGMPLNVNSISKNLEEEIKDSNLNTLDMQIVKFTLNILEEDISERTLWDYKIILSIKEKGEISQEDLKELHLFKDEELTQIPHRKWDERLRKNYDTFNDINKFSQYADRKKQLRKMFTEDGVELLYRDDWHTCEWKEILDDLDAFDQQKKPLNYIENPDKISENGLVYWERPNSSKSAGKRKRNIIVFNNNSSSEVILKFTFDQKVSTQNVKGNSKKFCRKRGKNLFVKFDINQNEPTFKTIRYVDKDKRSSDFTFRIAVLNLEPKMIDTIKYRYAVSSGRIQIINEESSEDIEFGCNTSKKTRVFINEDDDIVYLNDDESITISISEQSSIWGNENIKFNLDYQNYSIPFLIKEKQYKPLPEKSYSIWNRKRSGKKSFSCNGLKAVQDEDSFYLYPKFKKFLKMEREIIANNIFYAELKIDGSLKKCDVSFSECLEEAYIDILKYYKNEDNLPSLVYLNDDLKEKYEKFIDIFNEEVSNIEENSILSDLEDKKDLLKLGCIKTENKIMFSPLSPLNIAYQLEIAKQCKNEFLPDNILERLVPNNLIPYICSDDGNELYRPIYQDVAHEWLIYEKSEDVSIGTTNAFISSVVTEKLNQFVDHFTYLFNFNNSPPIKINLINIKNDKEVVKGIFNFIRSRLPDKTKTKKVIPVEIYIYEGDEKSYFDKLFDCESETQLDEEFSIELKKTEMFEPIDIIHKIQENISYYKHPSNKLEYEYAHLSFYKVKSDNKSANDNMDKIETGLSLDGLLSSVSSTVKKSGYRLGFGTKNILEENTLIKTAIHLNELVENSKNYGMSTYSKNKSVISTVELDDDNIDELYKKSHWVTFIEPTFGLEYFDSFEKNLIIIHYSDQYSSSSKYDTITVTNKSAQYEEVIRKFLKSKGVPDTDKELPNIIKLFNAVNGEWLLRIISDSERYAPEKLSIISAIKYCLAILDHKDIVWIPVSMEEILRIAGNVKLDRNKGIFDPSETKGKHSDDLLFIGVKFNDSEKIEVIFYPIEVKRGQNKSVTVNKAITQLNNTYGLLKKQLQKIDGGDEFKNKFFRNFFIQILLSNEQKFVTNHIWDDKEFDRIEILKAKLLNDEYDIIFGLENHMGIGSFVSFKTEYDHIRISPEMNIQIIELPEDFVYDDLATPIEELYNKIHSKKTDILSKKLLYDADISDIKADVSYEYDYDFEDFEFDKEESDIPKFDDDEYDDLEYTNDKEELLGFSDSDSENELIEEVKESSSESSGIRALIGTQKGYSHKVYWEFGHLTNKHMLIQGKSGQGKTYFIQRMLKELSNQGIPSIIIDYTDGFKMDQLEPAFVESVADKIDEHVVFMDRFPLNPFKKYDIEYGGRITPEEDYKVASRFKSLLKSVYNFGDKQEMVIYNAVLSCLNKYGENFNFSELKQELVDVNTPISNSVLTKLIELFDFNPFDSENEFSWEDALENSNGKITIIQLTTLSKDIQKFITEIVLRDLWNYKKFNGNKDNPFIVVLDEFHNLDLSMGSPSSLILKEGRKFGWSGWFATQSIQGYMKSEVINDLNNVEEKIYFHPTNISEVAKVLVDVGDRKKMERELNQLTKGYCIVQGPAIDSDGKLYQPNPLTVKIDEITNDKN